MFTSCFGHLDCQVQKQSDLHLIRPRLLTIICQKSVYSRLVVDRLKYFLIHTGHLNPIRGWQHGFYYGYKQSGRAQ